MCGISGIVSLDMSPSRGLGLSLAAMNRLQKHRGPDDEGVWKNPSESVGLAHVRLSIIDTSESGHQPMVGNSGNVIVFNGEVYNYVELWRELGSDYSFRTKSDTETILAAYEKWGVECVGHLKGMFSFALWDEKKKLLLCARDRFGIKPFHYAVNDNTLFFASEIKALLPFLPDLKIDRDALKDYLSFQFTLGSKTLFDGVSQLLPGHLMIVANSKVEIRKYWEVYYNLDWDHTEKYFIEKIDSLMCDSVKYHLRSDVPVGAYVSGGRDSGIIAALASDHTASPFMGFTGKFTCFPGYDESSYARDLAAMYGMELHEVDMNSADFIENIRKIIFHLDTPVAGPGSFPQYMVSKLAAEHRKVVLGGQGGDEIFGGYARYLIAYFEQCINGAIEGTLRGGNYIVTYESIIPNLMTLREYKPLLRQFWNDGLFDSLDKRYFKLVNRGDEMSEEINPDVMGDYQPYEIFREIFYGNNVGHESYFDLMTHFDFKTLLPALLQVEDRMSMAHGLESRVPFLDHPLIEFAATIPSNVKFKDGTLKRVLINAFDKILPSSINSRRDKMGFPVPLSEWLKGDIKDFVFDIFSSRKTDEREYFNKGAILKNLTVEKKFSRKIWGLLSLEIWLQEFIDKRHEYAKMKG